MKLLRLKITDPKGFRSLQQDFECFFRHPEDAGEDKALAPFICAGPNGSGKSNVLEALAAIFYHLECMRLDTLPDNFEYEEEQNPNGFRSEKCQPDAFELEFLAADEGKDCKRICVRKQQGISPEFFLCDDESENEEPGKRLSGHDAYKTLPKYLLAYSSGENEILSLPFFKMRFVQYDEYWQALTQQQFYNGRPESNMVCLDNSFTQAILLCNMLYGKSSGLNIFHAEIGLEELKEFRIVIKRQISVPLEKIADFDSAEVGPKHSTVNILKAHPALQNNEYVEGKEYYSVDIVQLLDDVDITKSNKIIPRLKRCATCWYEDEETGTLYLDYFVNAATIEAFTVNFAFEINGSPIDLFHAFQVLFSLNLYSVSDRLKAEVYQSSSHYVSETVPTLAADERIMRFENVKFKKTGVKEPVTLKALSDGEFQLLHSLGLCMLFQRTDSLFLLDEPETHFNPLWRSQFIKHLGTCLPPTVSHFNAGISRAGDSLSSWTYPYEVLITTHTPFLISDSTPEKVLVFSKQEGNVCVERPNYNTFGASINKITMRTFGQTNTIGGQAMVALQKLRDRFEKGEDKKRLLNDLDTDLGDSVEKILLSKAIYDADEDHN